MRDALRKIILYIINYIYTTAIAFLLRVCTRCDYLNTHSEFIINSPEKITPITAQ